MRRLLLCNFNIDTGCVELKYSDGMVISINCTAVENEVADTGSQCAELDWLIYNKPLEYADLILNGGIKKYLEKRGEHSKLLEIKAIYSAQQSYNDCCFFIVIW